MKLHDILSSKALLTNKLLIPLFSFLVIDLTPMRSLCVACIFWKKNSKWHNAWQNPMFFIYELLTIWYQTFRIRVILKNFNFGFLPIWTQLFMIVSSVLRCTSNLKILQLRNCWSPFNRIKVCKCLQSRPNSIGTGISKPEPDLEMFSIGIINKETQTSAKTPCIKLSPEGDYTREKTNGYVY